MRIRNGIVIVEKVEKKDVEKILIKTVELGERK